MVFHRMGLSLLTATVIAVSALTSCSQPASEGDRDELVLADDNPVGDYNPVGGYAPSGGAKMYDGLVRLRGGDGDWSGFEPALADQLPTPNADATVWTVKVRPGVQFSDGSALDAEDIAATYAAILNPASASKVVSSFSMVNRVVAVDPTTVEFRLKYSYPALLTKMLIGIVPSEAVATPGLASESALNTAPIGTGPYLLSDLNAERAVLTANENYWGGAPPVKKLTILYVPDNNTRAQRVSAGEIDGANLPPLLAKSSDEQGDSSLFVNRSSDYRFIAMPANHPVSGDTAIRKALNLAANRQAMVDNILGGYGRVASTPLSDIYGSAYLPTAAFPYDPQAANAVLDAAGWTRGPDGIRERNGTRAAFTVMYGSDDSLRRDLSQAFASDALAVGVEVTIDGVGYDVIDARLKQDGSLNGGGDAPYDPDTQLYDALHSSYNAPGVGGDYDNISDYANPAVDAALATGRTSLDPAVRDRAYHDVQKAYIADPAHVYLVFLDHTYVARDGGWTMSGHVLEPHSYGVNWGPYYAMQTWRRSQ